MEGIPGKSIYYHHYHQNPDDPQFPSRKYVHTVFYDCIEERKDGSAGVSDLYKGRIVFSERRKEGGIRTYNGRNDNNRDSKVVLSKKTDRSHGADKISNSSDASISSSTSIKVSLLSFYKVIKTRHGVRFKPRRESSKMFAKRLLNKRPFIGLKPGNSLINNNEHDLLNSLNDGRIESETCNKKTQNVQSGNELSEKLSIKSLCVGFNSNNLPVEGKNNTPPNTNYNKVKSNKASSSSVIDQEIENEITICRNNTNYMSSKERKVNREASSWRKQKLFEHMKNNSTRDKQTGQNNNQCKEVNTSEVLIKNVFSKNYDHCDACKDCAEIHRAMLANIDRTTHVATTNPAMMFGGSDILEKVDYTTRVATKSPAMMFGGNDILEKADHTTHVATKCPAMMFGGSDILEKVDSTTRVATTNSAMVFERSNMLDNNDTLVARKNATMISEGSNMLHSNDTTTHVARKYATMMFEEIDNPRLSRKKHFKYSTFDNCNSRERFSSQSSKKVYSYIGIDSLMSLDIGRKESNRRVRKVAHVKNYVRVNTRLGLLISWNLLQLVFLVVIFLWAFLCKCSFKKYVFEPRKCVRYDVRKPHFRK